MPRKPRTDGDFVEKIIAHRRSGRRGVEYDCMKNGEEVRMMTMEFKSTRDKKLLEEYKGNFPELVTPKVERKRPAETDSKNEVPNKTSSASSKKNPAPKKQEMQKSTYASSKRAQSAIEQSFFLETVRLLMFCSGDGKKPINSNVVQVTNMVRNELVGILNDASFFAKKSGSRSRQIRLEDVLRALLTQKGLLSRLLIYAETRLEMSKYVKSAAWGRGGCVDVTGDESSDEEKSSDDELNSDEEFCEEQIEEDQLIGKRKNNSLADEQLVATLKKTLKSLGENCAELKEYVDNDHRKWQQNLIAYIGELPREEYTEYAAARRATFQKTFARNEKKNKRTGDFLVWLGKPPLAEHIEFVLAFVAKETVQRIVAAALQQRQTEPRNLFCNDVDNLTLQLRHYEEVLRKNKNYRQYCRFFL